MVCFDQTAPGASDLIRQISPFDQTTSTFKIVSPERSKRLFRNLYARAIAGEPRPTGFDTKQLHNAHE